jgi:tetratricopeptide (TPR) repeat protein
LNTFKKALLKTPTAFKKETFMSRSTQPAALKKKFQNTPEKTSNNNTTPTNTFTWHYYIIPPIVLAAITALVYWPSLHYAFQFDDVANINKHFDIRHHTFGQLFMSGSRWITYWLNAIHFSIGRFDPFSYRLGNLIIHTMNGLLTFCVITLALTNLKKESFFKSYALAIASITALLFLLHPVQTQTVSYVIQGELEGLAMLATTSMTLCFLIFCRVQSVPVKSIALALLYVFGFFSCYTKEIAIVAPALIMIVDWFFVAQGEWISFKKRLWLHATIFGEVLFLYRSWFGHFGNILTLNSEAHNNIGNVITKNPADKILPYDFFISQFKVILHYLWMFIWPFSISVEYDWVLSRSFFAPDSFFPFLILVGIAYLIIRALLRDYANPIAFGMIWFFICVAPRSSIVPSSELLADYKTYMSSLGWLFVIACALVCLYHAITQSSQRTLLVQYPVHGCMICAFILALPFGTATYFRNQVWSSGIEFWGNIIKNAPGKARAYNNYGVELSLGQKKYREAIPYFKKAIAMDRKYPDPCNNLAVCYGSLERVDEAIEAIKLGLNINPYYPEGYNNLASFLIHKQDYETAKKMLATALKLRPYYGKAYFNLARAHIAQGNQEQAWECLKNACTKADLDTDVGFATWAQLSMQLKKYDDAIFAYKKVLEINPSYPEGAFNLANAYHLAKKFTEALAIYQELAKKNPRDYKVAYNIGESYFMMGRPQEALATFQALRQQQVAFPHLSLRIASCLEKLGQKKQARQELEQCAQGNTTPEEIKKVALGALSKLKAG